PHFRQRYHKGHFWSPGKFYRTVGDADVETVIQYVREHQPQQTSLDILSYDNQPGFVKEAPAFMPERTSQTTHKKYYYKIINI
ncbi:MAG: hypothetical protein GF411_16730, partial [Candidatus Lokiarchaeota archaeon]|nr:hypothetical protein [Candidatus Lokiarchaeota archaeon]